MKNPTLSRKCHICGKPLRCDCYYADYGLVKLDGQGHTQIEFDACPKCLEQVVFKVKEMLKAKEG